ncbi:V-type ATP synthase subunit I [uncultured Winogradskyella sp.]|uniref:V-type ATP synthase subunit I n=1 Tax=uncultured Winogradskyella sp. TaxID=395353 RepID=UPI0035198BFE
MIVRMKEILLFTSASDVEDTVQKLGEIGVVDIKEVVTPSNDDVLRCQQNLEAAEKTISILENHNSDSKDKNSAPKDSNGKDPKRIIDRVLKSQEIEFSLVQTLDNLRDQLRFYEVWGSNFKKQDIAYLAKKNIYVRLYRIDNSLRDLIPKKAHVVAFSEKDGQLPIALFTQDPKEKLVFKEDTLPELSFNDLTQVYKRKERQFNQITSFLNQQKDYLPILKTYLDVLTDRLNAEKALGSMGHIEGKVKYLKGYIPKQHEEEFKTLAHAQNWGFSITEPKNIDDVPVYIKNPKWISIINPMMKFIDIVPGYKEIDVSIYFLIAFALFFAMLVGDAGYGLIFLILTILLRKKIPAQLRTLIYVLSGSTIVWGVLSGTYFGAEQIAQLPFLKDLVIPNIASFGVDNINFMMHLSFLIGALHLTVAHGIRVFQFINSIKALSEVGWISLVWGLFFITEQLVLGKPAPSWYMWLFIAGALLVILFSKESTNFFKSMGASIANLPLSLISGFSDIVSYVRLFAVGMATAAVAASFNNMALPDGISGMGFLDLIMAAVALLLGHTLNIALALMAVMVHGIRLNMLEFAGHLGVQFSGEAYKPFKLTTEDKHI